MSKERSLCESDPVLAVEITLAWPVEALKKSLGALFHCFLEVVFKLLLLQAISVWGQKTELVEEEFFRADVEGLWVLDDHVTNTSSSLLIRESEHLLEALLDEGSQENHNLVASTSNLVILEENICAEHSDSLVHDIVS